MNTSSPLFMYMLYYFYGTINYKKNFYGTKIRINKDAWHNMHFIFRFVIN